MSGAAEGRVPSWTFGERLAKARRDAGLDQETMAERMGVSRPTITAWENDYARPRELLARVRQWAEITGTSEAWILDLRTGVGRGPSRRLEVLASARPSLCPVQQLAGQMETEHADAPILVAV